MDERLSEGEIAAFRALIAHDDGLRVITELSPHIDQLIAEAEYRAARRLVLQTWRRGVIFLGGMIAAAIVAKDYLREVLRWSLG